jgi:hypothetical protein
MDAGIAAFTTLDRVFLITGGIGAMVVVFRVILLFLGGDHLGALEDGDPGGEGNGFQFLSIHGLASFCLMFGLVGLALSLQTHAGAGLSILGGMAAGLAAIWVMARIFRLALRLQSSGTIQPQAAAGCSGTVYLTIPAGGVGRVTVRIGHRTREMDATTDTGAPLATGEPIRVVRVERSLAIVQPLSSMES